ncbi:hypothetical protein THRCLA_02944 [Thraustotheca clavata]|uniref:Uncharacterized protein n=1 Tax=Thraustotheca clavata TaxID=74557 RepID=A0A1W0A3J0_9STRA|nr:hypothetical protein THRCLA_02944 [Thraustotheca clavata]
MASNNEVDKNENVQQKLAAVLAEVEEQRYLLESAAANGKLLAEKYFVLEMERDALAIRCERLMKAVVLEPDSPPQQQTAIQKCIDLEQRLHTYEREKETHEDMLASQEQEIVFWRTKAMSCMKEHTQLKEAYEQLEKEHEMNVHAKNHLSTIAKRIQIERDELMGQVRDLTSRIADLSERDARWTMANDIKQQKIQRLEATVAELEEINAALEEAKREMQRKVVDRQHDVEHMKDTIDGLKRSLGSMEQEYQILLGKTAMAAPNKDEEPTEATPLVPRKKSSPPKPPRQTTIVWAWSTICGVIGSVLQQVHDFAMGIVNYASRSYHSLTD